jgi:hypothetical protein
MIDQTKILKGALALGTPDYDVAAFKLFKNKFNEWVHSSTQEVRGLPPNSYIVSGLTDAFNQTYALYNNIGVFNGEYGYHKLVLGNRVTEDLSKADVIIVSHPYSADGMSSHDKLKIADSYNKPIFVDCAFFGICHNIDFDFTPYKNIHSVGFSLSKTFGTGWRRVGLLYTIDKYPSTVYSDWDYHFIPGAEHHYELIDKMSPDEMVHKYLATQLQICSELEVVPSNTIIFGLDYTTKYSKFKRGNVNRLCLTAIMNEHEIPIFRK